MLILFHTDTAFYSPPDPVQGSHGSAIVISEKVLHTPFPLFSPLQVVALQIHITRTYSICSIYLSPSTPISKEDLLSVIRQIPFPFLIFGYFSGWHTLWGDTLINRRGTLVASVIDDLDLCILNTGVPTHYHIQTDLSLSSSNAFLDIS